MDKYLKINQCFFEFLVERLNSKVIPQGLKGFANSLWSYFMLNKEYEKATIIAKDLENEQYIQYRYLLNDIRTNNNIEVGYKFIELMPSFKKFDHSTSLGLVYSAMVDSYGQ